jgi:monofunctional glycosyltransferase
MAGARSRGLISEVARLSQEPPARPTLRVASSVIIAGRGSGDRGLDDTTRDIEGVTVRGRRRGRLRRWFLRAVALVFVVGALPLVLTLIYKAQAVHPVSTLMLKDAVTLQGYERRWTPLDEFGPRLVHSVMMSEDGQFCAHRGVDLAEFAVLFEEFMAGEATRGGSTITMQTAKNLYLWHGRSYVRKAIELPLAIYIDGVMSKRRIMEIYLNIAEWGPNIYGAEAAAQHHFGRSTRDLSARQAALLAVTLPNPRQRTPATPSASLNRLAAVIERRANNAGAYIGCLRGD